MLSAMSYDFKQVCHVTLQSSSAAMGVHLQTVRNHLLMMLCMLVYFSDKGFTIKDTSL